MSNAKDVVDFDQALKAPLGPETIENRKKWRFVKTQCPAQKLRLGKDVIQFRLIQRRDGGYASHSEFVTEDENVAKQLREIAKRGHHYVSEVV